MEQYLEILSCPIHNNVVIKLRKLRLSIDRLKTRMRQAGISSLEHVQNATLEVSRQLGYELKENKKHVTKEGFALLMTEITLIKKLLAVQSKLRL